jgi:hypothetical protein
MKRSRTKQKKPVATLYDLLATWQWDWLEKESLLWRFMPGQADQLRATPYPLDPATASLIEYLGNEYVLPWPVVQLEFEQWLFPGFLEWAIRSEAEFNHLGRCKVEDQFPSLDLIEVLGLWPVVEGMPGDWPSEFMDECSQYEQVLLDACEGTELLRKCVRTPYFPMGGTFLSFLPLIDGEWIDAEALALCEACGHLTRQGYVRLKSDDPHLLARHRYFPKGTWWSYPSPCLHEVFLDTLDQSRRTLRECRIRRQHIADRLHFRFDDYAVWEGRQVPGDLFLGLFNGLWIEGWNEWAQDSAVQQEGLAGLPIGLLPHPSRFVQGKDYTRFGSLADAEVALEARSQELALKVSAAKVEAGKSPDDWPFSDNQNKILEALDGKILREVDLALCLESKEELESGSERSKRRTLNREISLLIDMALVTHDRSQGGYYRPDRPPVSAARV